MSVTFDLFTNTLFNRIFHLYLIFNLLIYHLKSHACYLLELQKKLQKILILFDCWINTRKDFETLRLSNDIIDGLKDIDKEEDRQG